MRDEKRPAVAVAAAAIALCDEMTGGPPKPEDVPVWIDRAVEVLDAFDAVVAAIREKNQTRVEDAWLAGEVYPVHLRRAS